MYKYKDREFNSLIQPIVEIEEFQKTKNIKHHGLTRYDHSRRVAYFSYLVTKFLRLDYKETTKAAMLHDFFTTEVENEKTCRRQKETNYNNYKETSNSRSSCTCLV